MERALTRGLFLACRTLVRSLPYRCIRPLGAALGELQFRLMLAGELKAASNAAASSNHSSTMPSIGNAS